MRYAAKVIRSTLGSLGIFTQEVLACSHLKQACSKLLSLILLTGAVLSIPFLNIQAQKTSKTSTKVEQVNDDKEQLPSPRKAALLSALCPGLGQVYNKQYWKLPIIYGGIGGSIYGLSWNHRQYKDYFNAYKDFTVLDENNNPSGNSYLDLLPPGQTMEDIDPEWFERVLRSRKDRFKRYRDMSILILTLVYTLNIIDASVDAHLADFDVSEDISVQLMPAQSLLSDTHNPLFMQQSFGITLTIKL